MNPNLEEATQRIRFCHRKRRNHLNLAELGLTTAVLDGIPEFAQLTQLEFLDLTSNELTELPRGLSAFTRLRWLGLNFNRLQVLFEQVGDLRHLQRLYLRQNRLERLPGTLRNLHELVELDLNGNRLTSLGEGWHSLTSLEYADVQGNALDALPPCLGSLEKLSGFVVTPDHLPAELKVAWQRDGWQALKEYLYRRDVAELEELRDGLGVAELNESQLLKKLAEGNEYAELYLELRNNQTLLTAGDRVLLESDLVKAIWATPSARRVCTGKLITIGDTGMGKTCLLRALKGDPFLGEGESPTTQGMEVSRLRLRPDGALVRRADPQQEDDIVLHCWDMGGQVMYEYTHQIFFSDEAVYLGVIKAKERASVRELRRWLDLLRTRTQRRGIHVIITITCCTGDEKDDALERGTLEQDYPSFVFDYIHVNSDGRRRGADNKPLLEDQQDGLNIPVLRAKLAALALGTAGFTRNWLPGEARALEALTRRTEPYLPLGEAESLLKANGISQPGDQEQLLAAAHEVGLLLWKRHLGAARNYVVLSPDWLSQAVARILVVADSPDQVAKDADKAGLDVAAIIRAAGTKRWTGPVTKEQLRGIWGSRIRTGDPVYLEEDMPLLVELMESYEISYRGHAVGSEDAQDERFLIASMVDTTCPTDLAAHWPAQITAGEVEAARFISFELEDGELGEKDFERIVCQLIVRLHRFSLGVADISKAVHWRGGLLIRHPNGSKAKITVGTRELDIRVRAGNPQGLLDIIMEAIGSGETGVIREAQVVESVACWNECRTNEVGKGRWPCRALKKRQAKGELQFDCDKGNCERRLNVEWLLHPLAPDAALHQTLQRIDQRTADIDTRTKKIDVTTTATSEMTTEIRTLLTDWPRVIELDEAAFDGLFQRHSQAICQHMAQLLDYHVAGLLRELRLPGADGPRLFSIVPDVNPGFFKKTSRWTQADFKLTLWCEHSLRPLCIIDGPESTRGIQTVTFQKPFLQKCLPLLKWMVAAGVWVKGSAGLIMPEVAGAAAALGGAMLAEMTLLKDLVADLEKAPVLPADHEDGPTGTEWPAKFQHADRQEHGIPFREMTAFALKAREKYKDKDGTWAGMVPLRDGRWVHPRFKDELEPPRPVFT